MLSPTSRWGLFGEELGNMNLEKVCLGGCSLPPAGG